MLLQRPTIEESSARARFLAFGESSIDVEIFAYFCARDWPDFLRVQEEVLLDVMDLVQAAGARIALPSRITYVTPGSRQSAFEDLDPTSTDEARVTKAKTKRAAKPVEDRKAAASQYGA